MYKIYYGNNKNWIYLDAVEDCDKFIESRFLKDPPYIIKNFMSETETIVDYGSHNYFYKVVKENDR